MAEQQDGPDLFGVRLRALRERAGLSQQVAAGRAGISARALRDLEHDRVLRPRAGTLDRLAEALGLDGEELAALRTVARTGGASAGGGPRLLVLGPLVLRRGRTAVPVTGPLLRRLLGLLVLRHPGPASGEELVDTLWPSGPPDSHRSLLHGYVSQVRRLLAPDGPSPVLRTPTGYRLDVDRRLIDLGRFEELLARTACTHHAPDPEEVLESLTRALAWWRGPAFADDTVLRRHPAAVAADERRIRAALLHADTALLLRRSAQAVPVLTGLAAAEPLHEGLHSRLILALAGSGEQAAALAVFHGLRERLDRELGIDPGPEAHDAHLRVLRRQLPSPERPVFTAPVPSQLPAATGPYLERPPQLHALDAALCPPGRPDGPRLAVVVGPPGVGKSALAAHWARTRRAHFPDGQLYADLRGHSVHPAPRPAELLARFLRALGVPPGELPADPDEAAALYRTLLTDRRTLIVLDDARDAEQVRPLIPGAPDCAVLVTGRSRLTGLVAGDGARRVPVGVLDPEEGVRLLSAAVGAARIDADPEAARRLVAACGGLPLALRIAAADLLTRDVEPAVLADELSGDETLDRLHVPGDPGTSVRAALALSHRALPDAAQQLFRLFGLLPGPGFTLAEAVALTGTTPAETAAVLDLLTDTHLINHQDGYALHPLTHRYARELSAVAETRTARRRLLDHYLRNPDPGRGRPPAARPRVDPTAHPDDLTVLGLICWKLGRLTEAAEHFTRAARLHRANGSTGELAVAHTNLAVVRRALGEPEEAVRLLDAALPVHRQEANRFSETVALTCLSGARTDLGDPAAGHRLARAALTTARALHHRALQAGALLALAAADPHPEPLYREALHLAEAAHDRHPQTAALIGAFRNASTSGQLVRCGFAARIATRLS